MDHALYFVGAGLTKSLEKPGRPVPMMNDFISVMADYVEDDVILTTLAHWEILEDPPYRYRPPGMADLARPLADSTDRSLERRAEFRRALKNRPAEGIEQLLEKALTDRGRSAEVVPVRFRYGINRVFEIIGWDVSLSPLLLFLERQLALAKSHTVVSFNYDLVLDYAVSRVLGGPALDAIYGLLKTSSDPNIKLIKPHGSLNFIGTLAVPYEHTPYGLAFDEQVELELPGRDSKEVRYWAEAMDFKEPCIVPPAASKPDALKALGLSFLEGLRDAEKQAIKSADMVYIIGWSIPKTDEDQRTLIRESTRGKALQQLVVVNRGAPPSYFSDVADLFGVDISDLKIYNNGFCEFAEDTIR
jgi:hypothetical protein